VALVPLPADVVVPPAKPAPKSVAPPAESRGIPPAVVEPEPDSGRRAGHRGTLARAVKIVDRVKAPVEVPLKEEPRHVAPVRHEIPDVPLWSRGRPGVPDRPAMAAGRHRPAGFAAAGHHGCGGGRHRR
jgi:hypothetical protein